MKVQCCVCKRIRKGKRWNSVTRGDLVGEAISHGYCPNCADNVFKRIREQIASRTPSGRP